MGRREGKSLATAFGAQWRMVFEVDRTVVAFSPGVVEEVRRRTLVVAREFGQTRSFPRRSIPRFNLALSCGVMSSVGSIAGTQRRYRGVLRVVGDPGGARVRILPVPQTSAWG